MLDDDDDDAKSENSTDFASLGANIIYVARMPI